MQPLPLAFVDNLFGANDLFLLIIAVIVSLIWIYQFVQLMLLEDNLFPGRHDKALWAAVFVFAFPLAPFAFLAWKSARTREHLLAAPKNAARGSP